jgi:SAM-dependent methyltransferase
MTETTRPTVEHRVEAAGEQPDYSGREFSQEEVEAGAHRSFIGGVWDSHGQRQLDYLVGRGLQPHHRVLDIGCGPFRAGRHFVDYLEPGHYFGIDANRSLVQTGYDVELSDAQRNRLPLTNLRANDRFDGDFGVLVDVAMAQSVFTHVSLNHIRLCLHRTAKVVRPGGSFYATFFERPATTPVDTIIPSKKGKPFFTEKNVFWYYRDDLAWAASFGPWEYRYIGEWGHPAHQKMAQFVRLTDAEAAQRAKAAQLQSAPTFGPQVRRFVRRGRRWAARHLDPG